MGHSGTALVCFARSYGYYASGNQTEEERGYRAQELFPVAMSEENSRPGSSIISST